MKQAIILIAGKGRRLRASNGPKPKCLMRFGERTLLDLQIKSLLDAGIRRIILIVGYQQNVIKRHIAAHYPRSRTFVFVTNPRWRKSNVLGSLYHARAHLDADSVILHGDTLYPPSLIHALLSNSSKSATLVVQHKRVGEEEMKYISDGEGNVISLSKKLPARMCEGEFMGIAHISPLFGRLIKHVLTSTPYKLFKDDYYEWVLITVAHVYKKPLRLFDASALSMIEIDFPADYQKALHVLYPHIVRRG